MVFAYAWKRYKVEEKEGAASMNWNAYNKTLGSNLWLIARCHVLLYLLEGKIGNSDEETPR